MRYLPSGQAGGMVVESRNYCVDMRALNGACGETTRLYEKTNTHLSIERELQT